METINLYIVLLSDLGISNSYLSNCRSIAACQYNYPIYIYI